MVEAMKLVREELGEDAIIVSTSESGRDGVRITAAVETPEPELDFRATTDGAVIDRIGDALDSDKLEKVLNKHAEDGWALKAITSADVKGRIGPGAVEGLLLTFERPRG